MRSRSLGSKSGMIDPAKLVDDPNGTSSTVTPTVGTVNEPVLMPRIEIDC